jgi:hypothetical protein
MSQQRYEDLCHLFATCGYEYKVFIVRVRQINKAGATIAVCHTCGKVDIDQLRHWRECDPEYEQRKRDNNEWIWK